MNDTKQRKNMTAIQTTFILRIARYSHWLEKTFLVFLALSAGLIPFGIDASPGLMISLSGLAVVFFLYAYRPLEISNADDEPMGFIHLLSLSIIPKVLWISASISTMGIMFYLLGLNEEGYKSMLMIGGSSILFASFVLGIFLISATKYLRVLIPVLMRALPILFINIYIYFE